MSKERKPHPYYIVLQGKKVEVSKERYYEHYRPIWRTQDKMQRRGECICTKANLWKCEGICQDCPYYSPKADSIEDRMENAGKKRPRSEPLRREKRGRKATLELFT